MAALGRLLAIGLIIISWVLKDRERQGIQGAGDLGNILKSLLHRGPKPSPYGRRHPEKLRETVSTILQNLSEYAVGSSGRTAVTFFVYGHLKPAIFKR